MPSPSRARKTKSRADLEIEVLQAEARRHNAAAEVHELKAADERRLQDEGAAAAWSNRVYSFVDPVVGETVVACMDTLSMWSRLDPGCDITVILNSPGGYIFEGLALYDALSELKHDGHKLTIIVRGIAASMGGILLQAASEGERVVGAHSHVMIHELSADIYGKHSEMKDATKFYETVWDRLAGILAERSTMTVRQIKSRADRKDWWMSAPEVVKSGFADRVG